MGDEGGKILLRADPAGDMLAAGISGRAGGVQPLFVAVLGRYDTVGGHQDGPVEGLKFLFLFPPGVAVVAHKVGVLFKCRIVVGGKHLGVGVDVHAGSLCLLKQHLQVPQVMAGDQDAGSCAHANVHFCDFGIAVGPRVGLVQQSHTADAVFARLQGQRHQVLCRQSVIQSGGQGPLEEVVHFSVLLQQGVGMFGVGR